MENKAILICLALIGFIALILLRKVFSNRNRFYATQDMGVHGLFVIGSLCLFLASIPFMALGAHYELYKKVNNGQVYIHKKMVTSTLEVYKHKIESFGVGYGDDVKKMQINSLENEIDEIMGNTHWNYWGKLDPKNRKQIKDLENRIAKLQSE